jgi:hypothetical protein
MYDDCVQADVMKWDYLMLLQCKGYISCAIKDNTPQLFVLESILKKIILPYCHQ